MTFEDTAKRIIRDLMRDFGLDVPSACAIVGNFGHETGGFTKLQEIRPTIEGSRGGYGWAQWTGLRRRSYEAWCDRHTLDPSTYDANYGFAKYELQNDYAAAIRRVRLPGTLKDKVIAFEVAYEGAGVKSYDSRLRWAERALKAFGFAPAPPDIEPPVKAPPKAPVLPMPKPAKQAVGAIAALLSAMAFTWQFISAHPLAVGAAGLLVIAGFVLFRKLKG